MFAILTINFRSTYYNDCHHSHKYYHRWMWQEFSQLVVQKVGNYGQEQP